MTIITYTRNAKCSDCNKLRRYYKGNLKRHWCLKHNTGARLNDIVCKEWNGDEDWNPSGIPCGQPLNYTPYAPNLK